jgi:hypothetical protein
MRKGGNAFDAQLLHCIDRFGIVRSRSPCSATGISYTFTMSSLAGALIPPAAVASQPPSLPVLITDPSELKQLPSKEDVEGDGEMEDLFGNEGDANGVKVDRSGH